MLSPCLADFRYLAGGDLYQMRITRCLFVMMLALPTAQAGIVWAYYAADGMPGGQLWTPAGGILSGEIVTDLGRPAWQMSGNNCCGYWYGGLTSGEWTEAFTRGWSLSGLVRTTGTSGVGYMVLDVPETWNRFDITFGNDGTNGWAGLSMLTDYALPAQRVQFNGNEYQLVDMRWDPGTQSASLRVNGVQMLTGYTGHTQFRESHGPLFGQNGPGSFAYFRSVEFRINDPEPTGVPEPGTWVLTGAGAAYLLLRRRRG
jgi:hypothetical protein